MCVILILTKSMSKVVVMLHVGMTNKAPWTLKGFPNQELKKSNPHFVYEDSYMEMEVLNLARKSEKKKKMCVSICLSVEEKMIQGSSWTRGVTSTVSGVIITLVTQSISNFHPQPRRLFQFCLEVNVAIGQINQHGRLTSQKYIHLSHQNSLASPANSYIISELTHSAGVAFACGRQKCSMIVLRVCLSSSQKHIYLVACHRLNLVN